jgi:hypothetical protein
MTIATAAAIAIASHTSWRVEYAPSPESPSSMSMR